MSPATISSALASDGVAVIRPANEPPLLVSARLAALLLAGIRPVPTQSMLCCIASVIR